MKRSSRLVHSSSNELTRRLLEAGLRDDPSAPSLRAIASGLGLTAVSGVVSTIAAGTSVARGAAETGAVTAGAAPGAIVPGSASLTAGVVQWLAIGAIAGGVVSAGGAAIEHASRSDAPVTHASALRSAARARSPETATPPERAAPDPLLTTNPAAPPAAGAARFGVRETKGIAAAASASQRRLDRDGALARETAWLDAARRAIEDGRLADANASLDEYEAGRRIGVLNREALVLRVEVSFRQKDLEGARALVDRFEASYPEDPYLARLRARLASVAEGIDRAAPGH